MMKVLLGILLVLSLSLPVNAAELTAPEVPRSGETNMPEHRDSFGEGLQELAESAVCLLHPELQEAAQISAGILFTAMLFSLLPILSEKIRTIISIAGAAAIGVLFFQHADTMIRYAAETVYEISEYGKLLCPVLTTALAAQGSVSASAALYTGTIAFITVLTNLISRVIVPMVYVFLAFCVAYCGIGEDMLKNISEAVKNLLSWLLKTVLIVFTTYMSVTGVISGTTDASALKAAKLTISTVIPVVGGILSDTSESVLISMATMKNAAGIYGIFAVLAVFLGPFVKIGIQYLLLKGSGILCGLFADKRLSALINDFSTAMGLLLAMVAAVCILVLFSTVCFMMGGI